MTDGTCGRCHIDWMPQQGRALAVGCRCFSPFPAERFPPLQRCLDIDALTGMTCGFGQKLESFCIPVIGFKGVPTFLGDVIAPGRARKGTLPVSAATWIGKTTGSI